MLLAAGEQAEGVFPRFPSSGNCERASSAATRSGAVSRIFSRTVSEENTPGPCSMHQAALGAFDPGELVQRLSVQPDAPAAGATPPKMDSSRLVFPAPLGPTKAVMVPPSQLTFAAVGSWVIWPEPGRCPRRIRALVATGRTGRGAAGILAGLPALRLRGVNLAVVTFGFATAADVTLVQGQFPPLAKALACCARTTVPISSWASSELQRAHR